MPLPGRPNANAEPPHPVIDSESNSEHSAREQQRAADPGPGTGQCPCPDDDDGSRNQHDARPTKLPSAMLEHLKDTATPIRISYTRTKYLIHLALVLVVAWETVWLLSQVARRRPPVPLSPTYTSSSLSPSLSTGDQAASLPWLLPTTTSMQLPWWAAFATASSPVSKAYTALFPPHLLTQHTLPAVLRLLVPSCYLSILSGTLLQHLFTLLFTLTYLTLGLVASFTYAPLLDKITHVYLVWPLNYLVLDSLASTRRGASFFGHPMPAHPGPDDLSCAQRLLPFVVSAVYHVYLRRTLVAVRLWQHSRSFPHRHALAHQQGIVLGLVALKAHAPRPVPAPGVHPHAHLGSQVRQVLYRAYTLLSPYVMQWCVRHALMGLSREIGFPLGWAQVSPVLCIVSWVMLKVFVSFHCFQVECLVWTPGAIGKEGVLVWRGQSDGWRAGVFE